MTSKKENVIVEKSKSFAIDVVRLYQNIVATKREFVLSKQLLRSGTSIGANVYEAIKGQSTADFISKLSISLKESSETEYWLDLLHSTDYISEATKELMITKNRELQKILTSIINTKKANFTLERASLRQKP